MAATIGPVRILVIRPWTESLAPLRALLRDAGISARFARVDIEPALDAALARGGYDVIVFDPKTKELSLEVIVASLREHRRPIPIVVLGNLDVLVDAIRTALIRQLN